MLSPVLYPFLLVTCNHIHLQELKLLAKKHRSNVDNSALFINAGEDSENPERVIESQDAE